MTSKECCIACNCISGIGYQTFNKLVQYFGSAQDIPGHPAQEYMQVKGIGEKTADLLENTNFELIFEQEINRAERADAHIISICDSDYPESLKSISSPPLVLYIKGRLPRDFSRSIGIVGSRRITGFAAEFTRKIAFEAAMNGFIVVSGLAFGADKAAHLGTLDANAVTIAVIGSGLENIYPKEHEKLARDIINAGGAVISEQPMSFPVSSTGFHRRNRIIAGLSRGVLVTEAGVSSGSMITAEHAVKFGRPVFAVPGRLDNANVSGCHKLIKEGAFLTESFRDIAEKLGTSVQAVSAVKASEPAPTPELTEQESAICNAIKNGCSSVYALVDALGIPVGDLNSALLLLEMRDIVVLDRNLTYRVLI